MKSKLTWRQIMIYKLRESEFKAVSGLKVCFMQATI